MELSLRGTTDGGRTSATPAEIAEADDHIDVTDSAPTEFWDACWTLEDEWQPRATVRPGPRPHHKHANPIPDVFAML